MVLSNTNKFNTDLFDVYKIKLTTLAECDPKAPFSIATKLRCKWGRYSIPLTLEPYLIWMSVKQGGIKYHFLSLWYDSTWDWTQVSRAIGEHSNHYENVRYGTLIGTFSPWTLDQWQWRYSTRSRSPELEPHHQIQFSVIS